jgi:hypothetical protein
MVSLLLSHFTVEGREQTAAKTEFKQQDFSQPLDPIPLSKGASTLPGSAVVGLRVNFTYPFCPLILTSSMTERIPFMPTSDVWIAAFSHPRGLVNIRTCAFLLFLCHSSFYLFG